MKILINTPPVENPRGGVANHFKGLKPFWKEDVHYNYIGDRNGIPGPVILPFDLFKFLLKCILMKPDVVLLNPSLGENALKRDRLFLMLSKCFRIKTIVFFHGWNKDLENSISKDPKWFIKGYGRTDVFLVLANEFKAKLNQWGITSPIILTSTKVDDLLVKDFKFEDKLFNTTVLFLARVEANKGIFTAIETFCDIKTMFPESKLSIAGDGKALNEAKEIVEQKHLSDVTFYGRIFGEDLKRIFKEADIYILPTVHGEGMPTSVLEAMAFGLPVLTRPIGGLNDFFLNGKMGYLIESTDSSSFTSKAIELLQNPNEMRRIGSYNFNFSHEHFIASKVAEKLERIFRSIT